MSYNELKQIDGIKEAKATKLMACFEIAKRSLKVYNDKKLLINTLDVIEYIKYDYTFIKNEMFSIILVNVKGQVLKKILFESELSHQVEISLRSIVKEALTVNAYGIYMIHNHPSNDTRPSPQDIRTTKIVSDTLDNIQVKLIDHIIIGKSDKYYSFYENRLIIKD
jgi:DNA repair protein RadC